MDPHDRREMTLAEPMREILELARWAPSGDNTQPWRFEPVSASRLRVHGFDTRAHCVYDLDGRPSRLSIGAMLETLRIAATSVELRASFTLDPSSPATAPVIDVALEAAPGIARDPLVEQITTRAVQRRPLSARAPDAPTRAALEAAVGPSHELVWFVSPAERRRIAMLMFRSAKIRLTIEEAYRVHASVIEWHAAHSVDRIPDEAVGLDPISLAAMRWVMRSWPRARFVSKYLGGTLAPRLQLDLLPGILCGAHAVIARRAGAALSDGPEADFADGAAVQRFWLTAERAGLRHQPEMTPLIFSRYSAQGLRFTGDANALRLADRVRASLDGLVGGEVRERAVWIGRIGEGPRATARSLRLPLEALLVAGGRPGAAAVTRAASGSPS